MVGTSIFNGISMFSKFEYYTPTHSVPDSHKNSSPDEKHFSNDAFPFRIIRKRL